MVGELLRSDSPKVTAVNVLMQEAFVKAFVASSIQSMIGKLSLFVERHSRQVNFASAFFAGSIH